MFIFRRILDNHRENFYNIKQEIGESFEAFVTRLQYQVQFCYFKDAESMLKEQIIKKCHLNKLRLLALKEDMTSQRLINLGKELEKQNQMSENVCNRCGKSGHTYMFIHCPALRYVCTFCHKKGHFTSMCNRKLSHFKKKKVQLGNAAKRQKLSSNESPSSIVTPIFFSSNNIDVNLMPESHSYPVGGNVVIKPIVSLAKIPRKSSTESNQKNKIKIESPKNNTKETSKEQLSIVEISQSPKIIPETMISIENKEKCNKIPEVPEESDRFLIKLENMLKDSKDEIVLQPIVEPSVEVNNITSLEIKK
jgi:hypothetical protein